MKNQEIDQLAWENYWKKNPEKVLAENSRPDMVIGYVDGWNANPAQYTEDDLENLLRWATSKYANDRAFGWYLPGTGYRPNSSNVVQEWIKEHKQENIQYDNTGTTTI